MKKLSLIIILIVVLILTSIGIYIYKTQQKVEPEKEVPEQEEEKPQQVNTDLFGSYYDEAQKLLDDMTLDEKIAQILLVRYLDDGKEVLEKYQFGGYLFFEKDFKNKTEDEVKNMIEQLQQVSKIPILTAVDEEGGIVNRISTNPNLVESPFKSSQQLYQEGGLELIKEDTITKSNILSNLGINLNLAPVVDVSTNPSDYMYERSIGQNTQITADYAKTVIEASKNTKVSYTLKHFPGYGNNTDTHTGESVDNRTIENIKENDLPPFISGIEAKAEAVLISHNIVSSIDDSNPASLSKKVHELLTEELNFSGIIMTDAIDMGAISEIESATSKAIQAGNDLIITTDYITSINDIKNAIENNEITEEQLNKKVLKILAWKYYKELI